MNQNNTNPFISFRLKTLFGIVFVGAVFSLLARQLGTEAIKPWAFFAVFCVLMFLIGHWLVKGINVAQQNDPTTPSKVASFENSYEASILVSRLADFGIDATTVGTYTSGFQAESPGLASVFVSKEDYPAAVKVINQLDASEVQN